MELLRQYMTNISHLQEGEWNAFTKILRVQAVGKKQTFLKTGNICHASAFVASGLFKVYTTDSEGNEKIIQFNTENTFLCDCESYINKKPSAYTIEAVEDSHLLAFGNADLEKLYLTYPVFEKIGRHITQAILAYHKEHLNMLLTMSPQQRYEHISENHPQLLQRVSVTQLAQFLGLTRETVSRLRGKMLV